MKNPITQSRAMASGDGKSITLYGDIGAGWFGDGITAEAVKAEIDKCHGDMAVYINSPGGSVFEGMAIYSQLKRYSGGKVTCYVDGLAASIASVIAMAGSRLEMSPASMMMIHEAQTVVLGGASALRKAADDLDTVTSTIRGIYKSKTGMSDSKVADLMAAETWLTADDAVSMKFADALVEEPDGDDVEPDGDEPKARLIDTYKNTPAALRHVDQATAMARMTLALQKDRLTATLRRAPMTPGTPGQPGHTSTKK